MSNGRTRVAIVFGGRSSEHAVSCVSAGSILSHLDPSRYEAIAIGITTAGKWVLGPEDFSELTIKDRVLPRVDPNATPVTLSLDPAQAGRITTADGTLIATVDVVFPVLHGPFGEDGTVQGLLELSGLPYVGPGVLASAAGMDKEFTKKLLSVAGLPVGHQVELRAGTATLTDEQRASLGLPVFVKPARGGSSIGISRVASWDLLDDAIAEARKHDPKVIVESAIVGREVECGVLEAADGSVIASEISEIVVAHNVSDDGTVDEAAFYDFDTKYLDNTSSFELPAKLTAEQTEQVKSIAVKAFAALDCQGLARVDFFVTEDGPVINEINTLPGFTPISMYPRMFAATGIDYASLLATLINTAIARGTGLR